MEEVFQTPGGEWVWVRIRIQGCYTTEMISIAS